MRNSKRCYPPESKPRVSKTPQIVAYAPTEPGAATGTLAIPVPLTPAGVGIAFASFVIPSNVRSSTVELSATIGYQVVATGAVNSTIIARIFRDGREIFNNSIIGNSALGTINLTRSFQAVDFNVPPGPHTYTLSVERTLSVGVPTIVGPVTFIATAYSQ